MTKENSARRKKPQQRKYLFTEKKLPVLLLLLLLPALLHAHSETERSLTAVVSRADAVAVAKIIRIEKDDRRCSTRTIITVRPVRFIKGNCDETSLRFAYTVHQWKRARFFWQEDCPSVHYMIPPRLRNPKKGQQAVITIQYFKDQKKHFVTSMSGIDKLSSIQKMI